MSTTTLLAAVRRAGSPAAWSKAVELVRAGQVAIVKPGADELDVRVATDGGLKSALVTLFPNDDEWSCDCDSTAEACLHAAAAAIFVNRSTTGTAPPPPSALAHVGYRLRRLPIAGESYKELSFSRVIATSTGEEPLKTSLTLASRSGPKFAATQADMAMELALGTRPEGVLIDTHWQKVWRAFADCEDVQLDGEKLVVSSEGVSPRVKITDTANGGFLLKLGDDESVTERFAESLVLQSAAGDGALRRLAISRPSGLELNEKRRLDAGVVVERSDVAHLVTNVLPHLREILPVDVRSTRLPEPERTPVLVSFDLHEVGSGYGVLATLVYGDPPCARVDGDRLTWLGGALPIRTPSREDALRDQLRDRLQLVVGQRRHVNAEQCETFLNELSRFTQRPASEAQRFTQTAEAQLTGEVRDGKWSFNVQAGGVSTSVERVLAAWRSGRDSILLDDGRFARLPLAQLQEYGFVIEKLLRARNEQRAEQPLERLQMARLVDALEISNPPPDLQPLLDVLSAEQTTDAVPNDVRAQLRDYQQHGVAWLARLQRARLGALLADDMGLGKTLQTLASWPTDAAILVVAPTSVLSVWANEIARFRPTLRTVVYHGSRRELGDDLTGTVVITSYGTLRVDVDALAQRTWHTVVLDEAQMIKNPDSQVARAAFALVADVRIALSGTPIENRLDELWSLMHFCNPGLLPPRDEFVTRAMNGGFPLRHTLRPFVLRRTKEQVAKDLPPRVEHVLECELSADERRAYEAIHHAQAAAATQQLEESTQGTMAALEALLRLRQAATDWRLLPGFTNEAAAGAKVLALTDKLSEVLAAGHRAIVFSQWTSMLDLVEPALRADGHHWLRIDGSTTDRERIVREFQSEASAPVLLMSLKAGGVGLTLTAADYVFLLDPWWNPAVEEQATARAHRIGQNKTVFVYRLVSTDTVDEKLIALQATKRALFDAALGDEAFSSGLTRDELRALLA